MLMTVSTRVVIALTALAAASGALAQTHGQPPLYPYEMQQPYAVEVAPNTYVIHHPAARHTTQKFDRPHKPVDHGLVEQLRKSTPPNDANEPVTTTKEVVYEKPVVYETTRVVDDPPPKRRSMSSAIPARSRLRTASRRASFAPKPRSPSSGPTA
jgi:hypothetical protein